MAQHAGGASSAFKESDPAPTPVSLGFSLWWSGCLGECLWARCLTEFQVMVFAAGRLSSGKRWWQQATFAALTAGGLSQGAEFWWWLSTGLCGRVALVQALAVCQVFPPYFAWNSFSPFLLRAEGGSFYLAPGFACL